MIRPEPVRRERLADQVVSRLRRWLAEDFAPGDQLPPEGQLMEHFQVGRSTIREAVGVLSYVKVLQVRVGDGTYFNGFDHELEPLADILAGGEVIEFFEVRRAFEMAIAGLAATKRTDIDLKRLRGFLEAGMKATLDNDLTGFLRADTDFHLALVAATHNKLLVRLYKVFRESLVDEMSEFVEREEFRETLIEIHKQLYQAIERGSSSDAQAVWSNAQNPFL